MEKIKIYTIQNCGYCSKLKHLLIENNIEFDEIDGDLEENERKFVALQKISKSPNVPAIVLKNSILVADISFKTIEEGIILIKKILSED